MRIIYYDRNVKLDECAVALGFFDGVHAGHRALIGRCTEEAEKRSLMSCVFTFISEDDNLKSSSERLYSTKEKLRLIEDMGVDCAVVTRLSDIKDYTPEQFVSKILIGQLNAKLTLCGYNFKYGKGAKGSCHTLTEQMKSLGLDSVTLDKITDDGREISTTEIKELLSAGRVEEANRLLKIPYHIEGTVERGLGIGHLHGFPTVNLSLQNSVNLKLGVYRSAVAVSGRIYHGLTNVGVCPTVQEREVHAETTILDFDSDVYGERIEVYLLGYVREEKKFACIDELKKQIEIDKIKVRKENGESLWQVIGRK